MKLSEAKYALTFDDVTLVPQYSEVMSRKDPDVSVALSPTLKFDIPIIASPMNTISEHSMMTAMSKLGASSVLHRYMSLDDQIKQCRQSIKHGANNFFVAVGAKGDYVERVCELYESLGIYNFCVDVANGHSKVCIDAVEKLRKLFPSINIIAGNVCSYEGAYRLANAGANIIRSGVGGGSVCKTRVISGHGVPQLTALEDCAAIKEKFPNISVVADGGLRNSGDIVKALVFADAVMIGGLLAGTDETPGEYLPDSDGHKYKRYAGMASAEGRKFNGWFVEEDAFFIPEGEAMTVPCKGPAKKVIDNLVGGLRVGLSYAGASSLKELKENAQFVKVTQHGFIEGTPHGKK